MYIRNRIARKGYRMVYLLLCICGIILQYAHASMQGGNSCLMLTAYYTMLTNIMCFVYFGYLVVVDREHENPMVKGGIVMGIVLTGLGYHLLLSMADVSLGGTTTPFFTFSNLCVHTFTPLLAIVDYLLFTPKGEYKWYYPFAWLVLPALYMIFIFIRAAVSSNVFYGYDGTSRYPYPFIDVDVLGGGKVTLMILLMVVIYVALGFASYGVDKLLAYVDRRIKAKKLASSDMTE